MLTRTTMIIATFLLSGLLLGANPPAGNDESETIVREDDAESSVVPKESLAIVLSVPILRGDEESPPMQVDLGALREYLDMPDASEEELQQQADILALAAIQGLYGQIQQRDKILVELNEQNKTLQRQLNEMETRRREDMAMLQRLETRLNDTEARIDRDSGAPSVVPQQQNSQLSQRLGSIETDRRGMEAQLRRIESRMDTTISSLESRTREMQSRLSRLESRMMSLPRN